MSTPVEHDAMKILGAIIRAGRSLPPDDVVTLAGVPHERLKAASDLALSRGWVTQPGGGSSTAHPFLALDATPEGQVVYEKRPGWLERQAQWQLTKRPALMAAAGAVGGFLLGRCTN